MTAPSTVAAAMQHAIATMQALTPAQLEDLALGRGHLAFRPGPVGADPGPATRPPARVRRAAPRTPCADVGADVLAIRALSTPAEVAAYLHEHDRRFTAPVLREIARALGPTVSTAARSKTDLKRNIVEGTAGFRTRSASMSGGAWNR